MLVARHFERLLTEHRTWNELLDERAAALSPLVETETFNLGEPGVGDIETIDGELRLLARAWRVARELCDRMASTVRIDELLDERAAAQFAVGSGQGLS